MSLIVKQPKSLPEHRAKPSNTTMQTLVKSIEQSLRVEGYHVSSQLVQERLEAHFEK
jgi:hypothetical protein